VRHAHQRDEVDLLVDRGDPGALGIHRAAERHRPVLVAHLATVGLVDTGHHLDQGRLAGTVLAHQGVHLARPQGEGDIVQGAYAREHLGNTDDF
jgi:hypothetical protein